MAVEKYFQDWLDPIWKDATKLKLPIYLQFEITSRCNMMCKMCYIASNREDNRKRELPAERWLDIARQARDMGLTIGNITGGEPIIKEDFWQLHEGLTNLGIIYTLNTNGTLMTKENVKRLAQSPPSRVVVSIYGGSEETYEKVSNNGKWFALARAGVENLIEAGINTVIRMTLIRENLNDFPKVFEWADSLGKDLFYSSYMSPRREGSDTDPVGLRLTPSQIVQAGSMVRSLYEKRGGAEKQIKKETKSDDVQPEAKAEEPPNEPIREESYRFMTGDGFKCGAGCASGFISYDGNLLPCGTANEPFVSINKSSFSDAWREMVQLSRQVPSCAECDVCEVAKYCVPCPPKLITETGSYCKKSEYLCEHAHMLKSYHESLRKGEEY